MTQFIPPYKGSEFPCRFIMKNSLYVVMPAYNEKDNIKAVVEAWYPILIDKNEDSRLVIADNGSTDMTHNILTRLKEKYPKLEILENTQKEHGPKIIALYDYAIKQGIDYVFQTDSDGQTNPAEFASFWEARNKYDIVLGNRTMRGDGKDRAFVEKIVCFLLRIYFGINVPDANAPFRLMRTSVIKKYLYKLPSDYNLPNIMMTTYFVYYNEKVKFKEITFKPRQGGVNSINIPNIIKIGWKALHDFSKLKKDM